VTAKRFTDLADLAKLLPQGDLGAAIPGAPDLAQRGHDGKGKTVRVSLETKGRKGKSVTLVSGLQHNPRTLEEIARALKQFCGSGGTVKDGVIEIQGDQRARVSEKLRDMRYTVR
jgi:translation initiation factor 1